MNGERTEYERLIDGLEEAQSDLTAATIMTDDPEAFTPEARRAMATAEKSRAELDAYHARLLAERDRLQQRLDEAVQWIGVVGAESVLHGGEAGDRAVTLANLRRMWAERDRYREALEDAANTFQKLESQTHFVYAPEADAKARRHVAGVAKVAARRALEGGQDDG